MAAPRRGDPVTLEHAGAYDAVRLFLERAREARPNLRVDEATLAHVAAICARLNGIPLALELAAARTRTLSLERLSVGLDDAFRLLTGGARTALPRQQTLLASIAWSVDLLDAIERAVLRRFAVFQRSFAPRRGRGRSPPTASSSIRSTSSTCSGGWSTRAWCSSTRTTTATGCWRRSASSRSIVCAMPASWPRPDDRHARWFADWCEDGRPGRYRDRPGGVAAGDARRVGGPRVVLSTAIRRSPTGSRADLRLRAPAARLLRRAAPPDRLGPRARRFRPSRPVATSTCSVCATTPGGWAASTSSRRPSMRAPATTRSATGTPRCCRRSSRRRRPTSNRWNGSSPPPSRVATICCCLGWRGCSPSRRSASGHLELAHTQLDVLRAMVDSARRPVQL